MLTTRLIRAVLLLTAVLAAQTPPVVYRDVSAEHLPLAALGGNSMDARPADVDGDGDIDFFIAVEFGRNRLLINDGNGVFADESAARLPGVVRDSEDIGVADLDGDGDLDVIFVSEDDRVNELYLNDGAGVFSAVSDRLPVEGTSNAVLVADLDGDGDADILIGNQGQNRLLINDGSARFSDETAARYPAGSETTQDLEWGDITGDGLSDIVEGNENGNRILVNAGNGVFVDETAARFPAAAAGEETREADLGDVDGDGDLDLLLANVTFQQGRPAQNRLLINDGSGVFADETAARLPASLQNTVDADLVDLDGDGDLDAVLCQAFNGTFRVLINDGSGVFTDRTAERLLPAPTGNGIDAEFADVNGDGLADLYLCGFQRTDYLFLADPASTGLMTPPAPADFFLEPPAPNPFNPETRIGFVTRRAATVSLALFNARGQRVRTLLAERRRPGRHVVPLRAGDLASGLYLVRLQVDGRVATRRLALVR